MSFAEYDALATVFPISKKSCKTAVLQGVGSVSERRVFGGPSEAQTDRFFHAFAKLFVTDRRRNLGRTTLVLRRRPNGLDGSDSDLLRRQRSRCEPNLRHAESRSDLRTAMTELERPDRIGRRNMQRAVACDPRRPRVARDRLSGHLGPAVDEIG